MGDVADILGKKNSSGDSQSNSQRPANAPSQSSNPSNKTMEEMSTKIMKSSKANVSSFKSLKSKKPKGMSREVFSLLGVDSFVSSMQGGNLNVTQTKNISNVNPTVPSGALKSKRSSALRGKWIWTSFKNSARTDNQEFYHWVKADITYNDYPYAKFNIHDELIIITDDEFNTLLNVKGWSKEETNYLLQLVHKYSLRWPVIIDRYDFSSRLLEELQHRYYFIVSKLKEHRSSRLSSVPVPENNATTTYVPPSFNPQDDHSIIFNFEHERRRRQQLELQFFRKKEEEIEEQQIKEELKAIDAILKRANIKKNVKTQGVNVISRTDANDKGVSINATVKTENIAKEMDLELENPLENISIDLAKPGSAYLQSNRLIINEAALKLSPNIIKKMNILLQDLGAPEQPLPTKMVADLYDQVRKESMALLSIQSIIKKKEKELAEVRAKHNAIIGGFEVFDNDLSVPITSLINKLPDSIPDVKVSKSTKEKESNSSSATVKHSTQISIPGEGDLVSSVGMTLHAVDSNPTAQSQADLEGVLTSLGVTVTSVAPIKKTTKRKSSSASMQPTSMAIPNALIGLPNDFSGLLTGLSSDSLDALASPSGKKPVKRTKKEKPKSATYDIGLLSSVDLDNALDQSKDINTEGGIVKLETSEKVLYHYEPPQEYAVQSQYNSIPSYLNTNGNINGNQMETNN